MERQKSFSFKSNRYLPFSFVVSSSLIFLTFFTLWLFKSSPFLLQEPDLYSNTTSHVVDFKSESIDSVFGPEVNSNETDRVKIPENGSGSPSMSIVEDKDDSVTVDKDFSISVAAQNSSRNSQDSDGIRAISGAKSEAPVAETDWENILENTSDSGNMSMVQDKDDSLTVDEDLSGVAIGAQNSSRNSRDSDGIRAISTAKSEAPAAETASVEAQEEKRIEAASVRDVKTASKFMKRSINECDVTRGRWIYDESYPLYTNYTCPFIDEGFDCVGNGRLDRDYMKLRWQPHDCDIPRFNATRMLNLIRGKRLVFVGDSINRNQWESMLCMLMGAVKDPKKVYETHGRRITKEKGIYSFRFEDYKCTVEYYVSHFLVHEGKGRVGQKRVQTLRIDAIDHGSSKWKGADILIFNTAHWWSHFKTKAGINYYQEGNQVHPKLDVLSAFRRALVTWSSWVDRHINPRRTRVFFRSSAPSHFRGGQWNSGGHCQEAKEPLNETSDAGISEKDTIVEDVIKHMRTPVTILNITSLSQYRIDGHPSIFGKKNPKRSSGQDCSHWCLPGVPDVWNELLYFQLLGDNYQ